MRLNMNEFESYINDCVFAYNKALFYEENSNPKIYCQLESVDFLYDSRSIRFHSRGCIDVTITSFDYAEVIEHRNAATTIKIHTINNIFHKDIDMKMWHLKTG